MPKGFKFYRREKAKLLLLVKNSGFTIVEVLVSVSIIALVVGLTLPNLRRFNETQILTNESGRLVSTLRQAQSNSSGGQTCAIAPNVGSLPTSWRVYFYGVVNNYQYSVRAVCPNPGPGGTEEEKSNNQLSSNISIGLTSSGGCTVPTNLSQTSPYIEFIRDLTNQTSLNFNCSSGSGSTFNITLTNTLINQTKTIQVNKGGSLVVN